MKKAVALSSIGSDKSEKVGPVAGLHDLEKKLSSLKNLDVIYLRVGYFMENLMPQVNVIKNFGFVGGPLGADLPLPLIATRDIGRAAADLLLETSASLDSGFMKALEKRSPQNTTPTSIETFVSDTFAPAFRGAAAGAA